MNQITVQALGNTQNPLEAKREYWKEVNVMKNM